MRLVTAAAAMRYGAQFRSHNVSIMQSADNPHLVWCSAISGPALAPDRGTAIRREPQPCPWGLSASSASAASWWAWAAGRPAAVPPPPDWGRPPSWQGGGNRRGRGGPPPGALPGGTPW